MEIRIGKPLKRTRIKPCKKKRSHRRMTLEMDAIVRAECYERDGHKCVRCGSEKALAPSHVYPKGKYPRLRWTLTNVLTLCYGCHIHWWHKNPVEAAEWFLKTFPDRAREPALLKDTAPKVDLKELLAAGR